MCNLSVYRWFHHQIGALERKEVTWVEIVEGLKVRGIDESEAMDMLEHYTLKKFPTMNQIYHDHHREEARARHGYNGLYTCIGLVFLFALIFSGCFIHM